MPVGWSTRWATPDRIYLLILVMAVAGVGCVLRGRTLSNPALQRTGALLLIPATAALLLVFGVVAPLIVYRDVREYMRQRRPPLEVAGDVLMAIWFCVIWAVCLGLIYWFARLIWQSW
jgi:hypothetical protein